MISRLLCRFVSTFADTFVSAEIDVSVDFAALCFAVLTRGAAFLAGRAVSLAVGFVSFFTTGLLGIGALSSIIEGENYIPTKKCFI
jgi:hypothetical protein